jgi:hypothetical protein
MSMKKSNDTIGNRSRDLPVCSAMTQPLCHSVPHNILKYTMKVNKTIEFVKYLILYGGYNVCGVQKGLVQNYFPLSPLFFTKFRLSFLPRYSTTFLRVVPTDSGPQSDVC